MTIETNKDDRNLWIALLMAGVMILGCFAYASWGKNEQIGGTETAIVDDCESLVDADVPDIAVGSNAINTDATSLQESVASSRRTSIEELKKTYNEKIARSNGDEFQHASTDAVTEPPKFADMDTDIPPAENAIMELVEVEGASVDSSTLENTLAADNASATFVQEYPASRANASDSLTDPVDPSLNETLVEDAPIFATQNGDGIDELIADLPNEPISLDNGAIAESPVTDIAQAVGDSVAEGNTYSSISASQDVPTATLANLASGVSETVNAESSIVRNTVETMVADTPPSSSAAPTEIAGDAGTLSKSPRPFLGVGIRRAGGSVVTTLYDGSTAEELKLQLGDRITKLNAYEISDLNSIKKTLEKMNVGDEIRMTIIRNGETLSVGPARLAGKTKE